jgi:hypothetical protein
LKYLAFVAISVHNHCVRKERNLAVKKSARSLRFAFSLSSILLLVSTCQATIVTFDDLPDSATGTFIPTVYQGLTWSNFFVVNAVLATSDLGTNGAIYGMVTASNVAFNGFGLPAEIDARGTNFDFLSAYFTGAWNSNLNIQIEGFRGGSLAYNLTVMAAATNATLFTFDYLDIDRLCFNSSGGQDAGFGSGAGEEFVMDNFMFEFIPEPSSLLLTCVGAVSLLAFLRRKRVQGASFPAASSPNKAHPRASR